MEKIPIRELGHRSLVHICEALPGNTTILGKDAYCEKGDSNCQYYEDKTYLCKKQTLTPTPQFKAAYGL